VCCPIGTRPLSRMVFSRRDTEIPSIQGLSLTLLIRQLSSWLSGANPSTAVPLAPSRGESAFASAGKSPRPVKTSAVSFVVQNINKLLCVSDEWLDRSICHHHFDGLGEVSARAEPLPKKSAKTLSRSSGSWKPSETRVMYSPRQSHQKVAIARSGPRSCSRAL
jgi:hypothetical protein